MLVFSVDCGLDDAVPFAESVRARDDVGVIGIFADSGDLIDEFFAGSGKALKPGFSGFSAPKVGLACCRDDVKLASEFFGMLVNVDRLREIGSTVAWGFVADGVTFCEAPKLEGEN